MFSNYRDGNPSLDYLHCVFYNSPAFNYVIRTLPNETRVEEGIDTSVNIPNDELIKGKKRKSVSSPDISSTLGMITKSLTAPVQIMKSSTTQPSLEDKTQINELDISDRRAGTVEKLMSLEKQLLTCIGEADDNNDVEFSTILRGLLADVRARIDRTFAL